MFNYGCEEGQKVWYFVFLVFIVGVFIIEEFFLVNVGSRDIEWLKDDNCLQYFLYIYFLQRCLFILILYVYRFVLFCFLLYGIWWELILGVLEMLYLYVLYLSFEKKE